ncbi:MAG: right-handed parallel beta-helix repeat-containing protein [Minicystis sp.]
MFIARLSVLSAVALTMGCGAPDSTLDEATAESGDHLSAASTSAHPCGSRGRGPIYLNTLNNTDPDVVHRPDGSWLIQNVCIEADGQPGIRLMSNGDVGTAANVLIQNVEIYHRNAPGLAVASVHDIRMERSLVAYWGAPASGPLPGHYNNVDCYGTTNLAVSRSKLVAGASGAYLIGCDHASFDHVEIRDYRNFVTGGVRGPRGQCVQLTDGNGMRSNYFHMSDFTCEAAYQDPGSAAEDGINIFGGDHTLLENGVIDGVSSPSGVGVMFENGVTDGVVRNVDVVHASNGGFAAYPATNITFEGTRVKGIACAGYGRGAPLSGGRTFVAEPSASSSIQLINGRAWYGEPYCAAIFASSIGDTIWDRSVFTRTELAEGDFTPRAQLHLRFCTEDPTWPCAFNGTEAEGSGGRLVNLSIRSSAGIGGEPLIAGFVISGGSKPVLVRAVGPTLGSFGVPGVLSAPVLDLVGGSGTVASNAGWSTAGNAAQIASTGAAVGAFALPWGSLDAAALTTLGGGPYTAVVTGSGGASGAVLTEVYDADAGNPSSRLVNVSARALIGSGDVLIGGFVVGGGGPRTLLVRGVGPALSAFGVSGALGDPQLTLYSGSQAIAHAVRWGDAVNAGEIATTAAQVGAFALPSGSADSAMIVTLPPGAYTVHLGSVGGGAGVGLLEVYDVR